MTLTLAYFFTNPLFSMLLVFLLAVFSDISFLRPLRNLRALCVQKMYSVFNAPPKRQKAQKPLRA